MNKIKFLLASAVCFMAMLFFFVLTMACLFAAAQHPQLFAYLPLCAICLFTSVRIFNLIEK